MTLHSWQSCTLDQWQALAGRSALGRLRTTSQSSFLPIGAAVLPVVPGEGEGEEELGRAHEGRLS